MSPFCPIIYARCVSYYYILICSQSLVHCSNKSYYISVSSVISNWTFYMSYLLLFANFLIVVGSEVRGGFCSYYLWDTVTRDIYVCKTQLSSRCLVFVKILQLAICCSGLWILISFYELLSRFGKIPHNLMLILDLLPCTLGVFLFDFGAEEI